MSDSVNTPTDIPPSSGEGTAKNAPVPAATGTAKNAPTPAAAGTTAKESVTRRRARARSGKGGQRGGYGQHKSSAGKTAAAVDKATRHQPLDKETSDALTLFNTYLEADRERRKRERSIKQAQKTKTDAAAKIRRLTDRRASSSDIAAAEAAYREAVEALQALTKAKSSSSSAKQSKI